MDHRRNNQIFYLAITIVICLAALIALFMPYPSLVGAVASSTFTASATVGGVAPTIGVLASQAFTGSAGTTKLINVSFNATSQNGNGYLNDSSALVKINKSGETTRTSSACAVLSHPDSLSTVYNCTITLYYYDSPGTWTINASISDNGWLNATNTAVSATINNLDAVNAVSASISFSGNPGTNANAASPNPQQLNNTGNLNYSYLNVTAFSFTNGANTIIPNNVTINSTNSASGGQRLANNTAVNMTNSSLAHGATATRSIYFFLDIPNGQAPGTYNAQSNWILEAEQ